MEAPRTDADVPEFCRRLGIPGLVDVHVHFMPEQVLRKVWSYFDRVRGPNGAPAWPIRYRDSDGERVRRLRALGVRAFTSLSYPHKPGMAAWLNEWARGFAERVPECVPCATFYPEPEADAYVAQALEAGARMFKAHLQVGAYDPRDTLLRPVWRRLAEAGVPVVTHAGSGPEPGPFTGPGPIGDVMAAHPDLACVIAHMGQPEYAEFLDMALRYPNIRLDTTMAFTDFTEEAGPYPRALLSTLAEHPERILLGSDFPNIPYDYAHQIEALVRLDLGGDWLRAVCWRNGARLLGLAPAP